MDKLSKKERKRMENEFNVGINSLPKTQQVEVLKILHLLCNTSVNDITVDNSASLKIDTDEISDEILMHVLGMTKEAEVKTLG